jgi:hypothetical protein
LAQVKAFANMLIIKKALLYLILNILNVIDCVDRELSKYNLWTEEDNKPDKLGKFRVLIKWF